MMEGRYKFVEVDQAARVGPGEWLRFAGSAIVGCPNCGATALLDHDIDAEGVVEPSLECPQACGFHELAQLDGWRFGATEGRAEA